VSAAAADPARPPSALRPFFTAEEIEYAQAHAGEVPFTAGKKSGTMELPKGKAPTSMRPAGLFDAPAEAPAEEGLF
jgi:hypothetical protein